MATKVSVTTSSATSGAHRAADAGIARNSTTTGAAPANGFSSAMSAANRPHEADNSTRDSDKGAAKSPTGESAGTRTNAKTGANSSAHSKATKPTAANSNAVANDSKSDSSAAAAVAQSDVSLIDSEVATQDGKADRTGAKSRTGSTDTSAILPSDPAALALMLAASGMQVDGRTGSGQQDNSGDSKNDSSADAASATQAITAGALAAGLAVGALATAAAGGQPNGVASTNIANVSATGSASTQPAAQSDAAALITLESATSGRTLEDASLLGAGTTQTKSGTDDAAQAAPAAGPNAVPAMIRSMSSGATLSSSNVERSITAPVSDRNWSGAVAGQIQWMVNSNVQNATLQLSPEHLGPLEVHIDVQSSQVNVTFSASHADTRAALEQSVPRLREIMAAGGLTLGQTSVQQEGSSGSQHRPSVSRGAISASQSVDSVSVSSIRSLGLLDEYA